MKNQKETGLVLEGGGMRGIYTAGVLDVFMEHGITFDGVLGVSAGAIHGCSYVSGQRGRNIRYYKKYCQDWRFVSLRNFLLTGDVVGVKFCYHDLPEVLEPYDHEAFLASDTDFYVGCSNVETGKAEVFHLTDMKKQIMLLKASASLPFVSGITDWKGKKLLDGGCTDSIPVARMRKLGYRKLVVVQTRYRGYYKTSEFNPLAKILYHRYPEFIRALKRRHLAYNRELEWIEKLEREGKIFVIRPEHDLKIGRMRATAEELQTVYEIGRRDAEERLSEMVEWLGR